MNVFLFLNDRTSQIAKTVQAVCSMLQVDQLDQIAALVPGKPELALFYFVFFLPYISFVCLAAILLRNPARAPLRGPGFLAMTLQFGYSNREYCYEINAFLIICILSIFLCKNT